MNTLEDLKKLYNLTKIDVVDNMIFCDKETDAFGQGILYGIRLAIQVTERNLENNE